jgi:hypothetical protein
VTGVILRTFENGKMGNEFVTVFSCPGIKIGEKDLMDFKYAW